MSVSDSCQIASSISIDFLNIYDSTQIFGSAELRNSVPPPTSKEACSAFLVVKCCLKLFSVGFVRFFAWCFSMLLDVAFLRLGSPANGVCNLMVVDGVECLV